MGKYITLISTLLLALGIMVATPSVSYAQSSDTCTDQPMYDIDNSPANARKGIFYRVTERIVIVLNNTARSMFDGIRNSPMYQRTLNTAIILSIILYAVFFMFGIVPATFSEAFWRMVKIGLVFFLFTPDGWTWFNTVVIRFFDGGTNDIIREATSIALSPIVGIPALPPAATPELQAVQDAAENMIIFTGATNMLFSAKFLVTLIALPFTGPYGLVIFILFLWGIFTFVNAILQCIWIYLMSLIAKALLYGLAPIFIAFLLFNRTRHLFDGWLGQLINYSLQPILLFMFIGFYMMLLEAALDKILRVKLCWAPFTNVPGLPFDLHFWRFLREVPVGSGNYESAVTGYSWDNPFPIDLVDILIFLLISQLAFRYISVVLHIAKEISGGTVYLNQMPGTASQWFSNLQAAGSRAAKNAILSDVRMKENIEKVGVMNGINIYEFNYKGREGRFRGVLAHEVQHVKGAVVRVRGINRVNYNILGVPFMQIG